MRFYFKKESLKRYLSPIYWQEIYAFIEKNCQNISGSDDAYISYGDNEKTCLLYENLSEKSRHTCDFYIALDSNLKIPKEDFYLSSELIDEQASERRTVCLFPVGTSIKHRENANEIWLITKEDATVLSKLMQREVGSVAKLHGSLKVFSADAFEKLNLSKLKEDLCHCKKLLSFSKNKALNHWLYLLLGEDFIPYVDDAASPIRYAETNVKHPFLNEFKPSPYDEACYFKYDIWTSALRKLNIQLCCPVNNATNTWDAQKTLMYLATQCLASTHEKTSTLFRHLKAKSFFLPFALPKWKDHKNSLQQLMDFTNHHPQDKEMQQLLVTYLLNFIPQEYWYKVEHFFANQGYILSLMHNMIDALEMQFRIACSVDFAYGTYVRAIRDQQKYTCGWNQNLATCFDFVLNQNFEKIIEVAHAQTKGKDFSGAELIKLLLTPLLVLKKDVPKELINVCRDLTLLENKKDESSYGKNLFYQTLLFLLEGNKKALLEFLEQDFDPVKTQGYLGCLGLFLLKYDACYSEIGKRLLAKERTELLAKKPLALQIKAWGMLTIGDKDAYDACAQILAKDKTYFKQCQTFPEKWFIQSKIEAALGHHIRAKHFRFLHNHVGISPYIWEMFE